MWTSTYEQIWRTTCLRRFIGYWKPTPFRQPDLQVKTPAADQRFFFLCCLKRKSLALCDSWVRFVLCIFLLMSPKSTSSGEFLQGKHDFCLCCAPSQAIYVFVLLALRWKLTWRTYLSATWVRQQYSPIDKFWRTYIIHRSSGRIYGTDIGISCFECFWYSTRPN